jgi:hypothetical protein
MPRRLTFVCVSVLLFGMIVDGNAASTLKMTCNGDLTNTREDGVTLGQCDLNFISVKQMAEIENVCGIPGTVDSPAENQWNTSSCLTRSNFHRRSQEAIQGS